MTTDSIGNLALNYPQNKQLGKVRIVELDKWITTKEAAKMLGTTRQGVFWVLKTQKGKGDWIVRTMNFGTDDMPRWRLHKDDVQAIVEKRSEE